MGETYTGPVAWFVDPETGEGSYRAFPETDWESRPPEEMHLNEQHPHARMTPEEILECPKVIWVEDGEPQEVQLEPQVVPGHYKDADDQALFALGRKPATPKDQEGWNEDGTYTFGSRVTKTGGGHFELA